MNLLKHFLFLVLFIMSLLLAQHSHGSHGHSHDNGCELFGTVVDSLTILPIEYASISLLDMKNEIITGGVTNADGKFYIHEIKPGKYLVRIEFMGFKTVSIPDVKLSFRENKIKDLGQISLVSSALELEVIKVIDDKPIFEFETDKMIYNSSDDIIADSGTAEDVLNKVPMVTVDQDGEVALRGNPNVKILVNGRPNRTGEGGKSVDNIPASLIDKVEVITSPSAKYDPDGMAGIINIVLKKGKYEGLNGSIKINGKHNSNGSIGDMNGFTAYGNYKGDIWNVYTSYNHSNRLRYLNGHRIVNTQYDSYEDLPTITDSIYYNFLNNSDRIGQSIKLGTDYSVSDNLIINMEVNYDIHLHSGYNNQDYLLPNPHSRKTDEIDFKDNYDLEGFFEINQTFDNPDQEFNLSLNYDYQRDNENEILIQSSIADSATFLEDINGLEFDLHYKYPFNENSKMEFGYDGRFNKNEEKMTYQITDETEKFAGVNNFQYNRSIHGFFMEFDHKLNEKFSIKPSIRYEYVSKDISFATHITDDISSPSFIYAKIIKSTEDNSILDDYHTIYPDLHITYNITEKQSLQFGLSKRVNRPGDGGHGPGSRQIRPFPRDVYSDQFIFMGNPFLEPEYSTQYEMSFKSPMPMGFAYINLYYHQLKNVIEWYDDDSFTNADVLTFKNADSGENMGIEVFTMIMGQTLGGGYNFSKLDDPSGDYELNGNSQRITLYNRINLPEKYIKFFSFEFGFFFMKMAVPGGDLFGAKGTMWANTAISKSLLGEAVEVSFGINNLFDAGGFQMKRTKPLEGPFENGYMAANEFTDVTTNRGGRTFTLNIKYRFGEMQKERESRRHGHSHDGDDKMDMGF